MTIAFRELYTLCEQGSGAFALGIARRKSGQRFLVRRLVSASACGEEWCAIPSERIGDAPDKYHPLFVAALLTARNSFPSPREASFPAIDFTTAAEMRRSMTMNALRMTCEYAQQLIALPRVLQLVAQHLEAGQRDIAHDALVYVMRQILAAREDMGQEKQLRAAAITAFLGLPTGQITALSPRRDAQLIEALNASTRRVIDVASVLEMQRRILRGALARLRRTERQYLQLADAIASKLWCDEEE